MKWENKENFAYGFHNKLHEQYKFNQNSDLEHIILILNHQQEAITQMQRQLQRKVNKSQIQSKMNSNKTQSLDITAFSLDNHHTETLQTHPISNNQQDSHKQTKTNLQLFKQQVNQGLQKMITLQIQLKVDQLVRQMRDNNKETILRLQKKCQRSELDKTMHLTSLLAIEFELIKKRFNSFQTDYNLIWKQISKLYTYQQNLRSAFQTERKEPYQNTNQKYLQVLFKNSKNPICTQLFNSHKSSFQRQEQHHHPQETNRRINDNDFNKIQLKINELNKKIDSQQQQFKIFKEKYVCMVQNIANKNVQEEVISELDKKIKNYQVEIKEIINQKQQQYHILLQQSIKQKIDYFMTIQSKNIFNLFNYKTEQLHRKINVIQLQSVKKEELISLESSINSKQKDLQLKFKNIHDKLNQNNQKYRQLQGIFSNQSILYQKHFKDLQRQTTTLIKVQDFRQAMKKYVKQDIYQTDIKNHQNTYKQEIKKIVQHQQQINQIVCSQNIVMRWVWVTGQLKGGNLISWDRQVINTLPQNFIYQKDQYYFKIITSGIYKIEMGFYAKKKPTIQIIVNGQAIVSAVNSNSYVLHHSSGKLKDISNAEVTGITYNDYYTIQQNSRIAISYCGQLGHGFINIQRL